ncbi:MAG: hypothetical protein LBV19_00255 [Streptococcaceae bacterium]|jgi:hypothetical protein|nr:hypothetical protein [Streptococcaceae bacterium]
MKERTFAKSERRENMTKGFKKTATAALLTLSLIGAGGTTANALKINVAGGTFNFGVNHLSYVFYRQ